MLALGAVVWLIYAPVLHFGFVNWDDGTYVLQNPAVLNGLSWAGIKWAFTTAHAPYWHPLTWMSHMLDVSVFGVDAGAFHQVNVWLHLANACLVFVAWYGMTRSRWPSAILALVFALHPIHVESVAWIAERKDLLSSFWLLVGVVAYVAYTRRPTVARYVVVAAAFALALLAKPMVVTFPLLLLILDVWPLERLEARRATWRTLILEKAPLAVAAAVTSVITVVVQRATGALPDIARLSVSARLANAIVAVPRYLAMLAWPAGLAAYYPLQTWSVAVVAAAVAFVVVVTAFAIAARKRFPALLAGWLWFVVGIMPVSGVVQSGGQSIADRFVYLPMLGIAVAVVWTAYGWLAERGRFAMATAAAIVVVAMTAASVEARAQVMTWSTSETLWTRVVSVTAPSERAYEDLGQADRESGHYDQAVAAYEHALTVPRLPGDPSSPADLHDDLGITWATAGHPAEAAAEFEQAAALDPGSSDAYANWGNALAALGRRAEAETEFKTALRLNPRQAEARTGLANIWLGEGRIAEAVEQYRIAVSLQPGAAETHGNLGSGLADLGDDRDAVAEYRIALRLDPRRARTHLNLGLVLMRDRDSTDAREELIEALQLDPTLTDARCALDELHRAAR